MLQQILLDLETAVELLTALDKSVQYLSNLLLEELDEAPDGKIDINRVRLHVWMISTLTGVACSSSDMIESVYFALQKQGSKKGG